MYGLSDEYAYVNAKLKGTEKSVKILVVALKKITEQGSAEDKAIAYEGLAKHYEQEKQTKKDAEKA
jgi:hypothetical protein